MEGEAESGEVCVCEAACPRPHRSLAYSTESPRSNIDADVLDKLGAVGVARMLLKCALDGKPSGKGIGEDLKVQLSGGERCMTQSREPLRTRWAGVEAQ